MPSARATDDPPHSDENLLIVGLRVGSLGRNRLEVEFALALLVEHTIASGAAAAYMHPVSGHHHDRSWAEISDRRRIRPRVPDAADDHVLELAAVRVQRVIGAGRDLAHLGIRSHLGVAREHGELHALPLGELDPLQLGERHHQRGLIALLRRRSRRRPLLGFLRLG